MATTRQINIIVAGKTLEPRWLTTDLAKKELQSGLMAWDFASDDEPDIVFAAVGDYLTKEALAALDIVKAEWPDIKIRFVNVMSLTSCGLGQGGMCLTHEGFNELFTPDKPVIINFHGYPETLKSIIFDYINSSPQRFSIHGYIESGSTTTPFDMHVRNHTSRYHLVIETFEKMARASKLPYEEAKHIMTKYEQKIADNIEYIKINGVDMPEIEEWQWSR